MFPTADDDGGTVPVVTVAQSIDPTVVADAPGAVRAGAAFVLVLAFGGAFVYRYHAFLDRCTDASLDRPLRSAFYGAFAQVGLLLLGGYVLSQLGRVGSAGSNAVLAVMAAVVVGLLVLSGLGLTVVGSVLTELLDRRRPEVGLVVGACLGAAVWLFLPVVLGSLAWIAVVSVGIGGVTWRWVHDTRSVEEEAPVDR